MSNTIARRLQQRVLDGLPLDGLQVIDAHTHLGPYSRFFIPDHGVEEVVRVMDRVGVATNLVSTHLGIELDATAGNDDTAAAVDASRGRLHGLMVLNPHQNPTEEIARRRGDPRFVGIKLHPDLHQYPITGPRYGPAWEYAAEYRLPVLVHSWSGSAHDDPSLIAQVADRYPRVPILLGHSGTIRAHFDQVTALAQERANLYLELCGTFMTSWWVRRFVDAVGADRVIFGSDQPFIDVRYSLGRVLFAGLDDHEITMVLGGSIRALLPHVEWDTAGRSARPA
ncbi:amidohydrolase family protein [Saccharopolyspora sp. NPDC002376]